MRLFTKGKAFAGILLAKVKVNYTKKSVRIFNYYFLLLAICCLGATYLFNRHPASFELGVDQSITITALLLTVLLFFQLVRVNKGKKAAERKLQITQVRFDKVYNAGIVGLLFTRLDGVVIQANDCFLSMIGYSADELAKGLVSWKTLTPEKFQSASAHAVEQLKTLGYCEPFEKEYLRKDGTTVSVILASSLLDSNDSADAVTFIIDISHKQQARVREDELNQYILKQKEELQRLLMNAPAMISLRRGPELRLEFSNQASRDYSGNKDHLGLTPKEIAAKFNINTGTGMLEKVYRTGESFTAKAFNLKFDRTGNGQMEEAWFDFVLEPLMDEQGRIDGVASFGFDVTDMVKANMELKESENRFRFLADSLAHKIWTCGPDGKANYYNKGWYDYLNAGTFEELHTAIWASIHPDDLQAAQSLWAKAVVTGDDLELEQRFKNAKGEYQWHLTRCCAHKNTAGEIVLWVGSCTNIQDQKVVQETADLLSRKKDEFLGIASHELKTPITSMKASLQILDNLPDEDFKPAKVKSFVGMANRQVKKLNAIVDELLDVTRIESGKMALNYTTYSLSDSVRDCAEEIRSYAKDKYIILTTSPDIMVIADKVRLEQVIVNLLTNAAKYSPAGGTISIELENRGGVVRLTVIDNGIGIPPSRQRMIFEKFSRAHEASQKYSGLGLGLYISSQIVRQHGGDIGVYSEAGNGAKFWFELPLYPDSPN
ncbi:PAS domain-containing sensor histidine kinase [Mucilaginibacter glaciei]|uniref:histidine kinase n=1 Tax=Mucilaginibacter glaciei TaxID=2772109 RepID=A0A926S2U0_9SPHI|nr:PAS domain-containing sensor histidine kinase [Mucilaginibacter glaciei]MBD1395500.1 PAS domain S-box protein [Mucilaginibacter glaciei]